MAEFSLRHRPAKSWRKVSITVDPIMTEAVAAYLADLTGGGLEITSPADDRTAAGSPGAREKLTAYIPVPHEEDTKNAGPHILGKVRQFIENLQEIFPGCRAPEILTETIPEEDWGRKWKSFFTTFQITPGLIVKPSWEGADRNEEKGWAGKFVLEMDPGLAFGTGHHASTQLALLLLEELFTDGVPGRGKVLDVGTGSGILAMACGLFGAREVVALDNDPDAVATAEQNIIRNRLQDRITVSGRDVATLPCCFDIVAANITSETLADLKESLTGLMENHGYLVLSGLLKGEQEDAIIQLYAQQGIALEKRLTRDEWAALLLQKT